MKTIYPVPEGHRRMWLRCGECGHIDFVDYVPSALMRLPHAYACGHNASATINADEAIPYLLSSLRDGILRGGLTA